VQYKEDLSIDMETFPRIIYVTVISGGI